MPNKKNITEVESLKEVFSKASSVFFTEYHGLNVAQITKLRSEFHNAEIKFKVAKNTLLKLALEKDISVEIEEVLSGSTAIAVSFSDPSSPAKVIKDFTKENDLPRVKGILFEGKYLPGEAFEKLADMPSKEQMLSQLLTMLNSPLQKFASTIASPFPKLLGALNSLKDIKNSE
tara:strand:+ start:2216 stop:2737 length:522 start_codon:yes stop_codon:yes gene_type:complete